MNNQLAKCRIERFYANNRIQVTEDVISAEVWLSIEINGLVEMRISCSPHELKELVMGYIFVEYGAMDAQVSIESTDSACEYRAVCHVDEGDRKPNRTVNIDVSPKTMMQIEERLLGESQAFKATGNMHATALCSGEEICFIGEDISRHNTLYRVLGSCVMAAENPSGYYLCTSGRLPYSMVEVAAKAGVSVVVSRSAPTDIAIALAEEHGITLAGFASEKRVNLYTTPASKPNKTVGLVILAGGKSVRMNGTDKSGLRLGDRTFLEKIGCELSFLEEKLLSMGEENSHALEGFQAVFDETKAIGAMGGIYSALRACKSDALFVAPCDTPLITKKYAQMAIGEFAACDACLFQIDGKLQPLNGIYGKSCLAVLEKCIKNKQYKLAAALGELKVKTIKMDEKVSFLNVNMPDDYRNVKEEYEKITTI